MRTVDPMTTKTSTRHRDQGVAPDPEMARRLRAARALTGLDQTEFAKLTGISRSIVSRYETATNTVDYKHPFLVTWAYHSAVTLEWLETGLVSADPSGDNDRYSVAA